MFSEPLSPSSPRRSQNSSKEFPLFGPGPHQPACSLQQDPVVEAACPPCSHRHWLILFYSLLLSAVFDPTYCFALQFSANSASRQNISSPTLVGIAQFLGPHLFLPGFVLLEPRGKSACMSSLGLYWSAAMSAVHVHLRPLCAIVAE